MYYIYSTATSDTKYVVYKDNKNAKEMARIDTYRDGKPMEVVIKGGANLQNKFGVTPKGVMTEVTNEEYGLLLDNDKFKKHLESGFVIAHEKEVKVEKAIENMQKQDKSRPLTKEGLEEDKEIDERVYKKKSSKK